MKLLEAEISKRYKDECMRLLLAMYPHMKPSELEKAIEYSIEKRYKQEVCNIDNNYKNKTIIDMTLLDLTEYILKKEPICTAYGVLFQQHGVTPNPLELLIQSFMDGRDINKKKMFSFPKGSEGYAKYNLAQLLDKRNANSIYGCLGNASSVLYNIYVAASIPAQGRALISTATLFFESFLSNNVKFGSLEEILHFIDKVCLEAPNRKFNDREVLDRDITVEECFAKLILTTGDWRKGKIKWIPDFEDAEILFRVLDGLSQENINRIYYKNNLYEFLDNTSMTRALIYILTSLNKPYLAADKVPEEIKIELDMLQDYLREYVYYSHMYIDRIDRVDQMIKDSCVISDTDSTIVSFDAFYHYTLDKIKNINLPISNMYVPVYQILEDDKMITPYTIPEMEKGYDFYNDEIIERQALLHPYDIIPQNNVRYSILNIIAYIGGNLCNEYIEEFTKTTHSWKEGRKCLMYLKNEFTFYRALLTDSKKNYATIQEVQEGNIIPQVQKTALDIKGLPINKSTVNATAKKRLQKILYEYILKPEVINQAAIIEQIAILEKEIELSLKSGSKEFLKPAVVKAISTYANPMSIQGVKASTIWNMIKDDDVEAIDLNTRNTVGIAKVKINLSTMEQIRDKYPETYDKMLIVLKNDSFFNDDRSKANYLEKREITAVAIPVDTQSPEWMQYFIDYSSIINDSISTFPMESVGITRLDNQKINYSSIMSI